MQFVWLLGFSFYSEVTFGVLILGASHTFLIDCEYFNVYVQEAIQNPSGVSSAREPNGISNDLKLIDSCGPAMKYMQHRILITPAKNYVDAVFCVLT